MDTLPLPERVALDSQADSDPLTSLPTRHRLIEALTKLFNNGASPALILIDLDRFKSANAGFGPAVGDALLYRVARRLVGVTKGATMLARVDGDGFGVLLEDSSSALGMAEGVVDFLSRPFAVHGHSLTLSASVGVAMAPQDGDDSSEDRVPSRGVATALLSRVGCSVRLPGTAAQR